MFKLTRVNIARLLLSILVILPTFTSCASTTVMLEELSPGKSFFYSIKKTVDSISMQSNSKSFWNDWKSLFWCHLHIYKDIRNVFIWSGNTENIFFICVDDVSLENTFNALSTVHEHKFVLFMRFYFEQFTTITWKNIFNRICKDGETHIQSPSNAKRFKLNKHKLQ